MSMYVGERATENAKNATKNRSYNSPFQALDDHDNILILQDIKE